MEKVIGRYLTKNEVVCHKDRNRSNNDPQNLILFSTKRDAASAMLKGKRPNWKVKPGRKKKTSATGQLDLFAVDGNNANQEAPTSQTSQ